jgi:hypothetical protein
MTPLSELASVVAELTAVFDPLELALWLARGNSWLDGRMPVEALGKAPGAVLEAARADRFIHKGQGAQPRGGGPSSYSTMRRTPTPPGGATRDHS